MSENAIFLCNAKRTAIGSFGGALAGVSSTDLGAAILKGVIESAKLPGELVQEVIMGQVLSAGTGQAPTRQAMIKAGLPPTVHAMTINKVCSSGLKAVMLATTAIRAGETECAIAGGMENMSQAPYLLPSLRNGARLGHTQAEDSIIRDGLWDVYNNYHMGNAAELCAREFNISRIAQDEFALESYRRANDAIKTGKFADEILSIKVPSGRETVDFAVDEEPGKLKADKVPQLKPAFLKDGTITAANASSLNDGAAAMIVCTESFAKKHNLDPFARVIGTNTFGQAPEWFTTAPVGAIEGMLSRAKMTLSQIDLIEINEAFSAVGIACGSKLSIPKEKLNVCGGAVALGHPIGASGARILTTLLYSLRREKKRFGIAAICNGGGEATSMLVERI